MGLIGNRHSAMKSHSEMPNAYSNAGQQTSVCLQNAVHTGLVHSGTNGWTQLCILDATNNEGVHKYVNIEYQVSRASEVNGQGAVRSATYEFLLVAHSNHGRISKRLVTIHDFHLSFLPAAAVALLQTRLQCKGSVEAPDGMVVAKERART